MSEKLCIAFFMVWSDYSSNSNCQKILILSRWLSVHSGWNEFQNKVVLATFPCFQKMPTKFKFIKAGEFNEDLLWAKSILHITLPCKYWSVLQWDCMKKLHFFHNFPTKSHTKTKHAFCTSFLKNHLMGSNAAFFHSVFLLWQHHKSNTSGNTFFPPLNHKCIFCIVLKCRLHFYLDLTEFQDYNLWFSRHKPLFCSKIL